MERWAVETFDTNVLVRLLVNDDASQCERAERVWRTALTRGGVFIPTVVMVELVWVLRRAYKFDRDTVTTALRRLADSEGVEVENHSIVDTALLLFSQGAADFSDYVILETARRVDALPLHTFDELLARSPTVELA